MGGHALLQGVFPTQGLNPGLLCLLHWQASPLPLAPPGKHHTGYRYIKDFQSSNPWDILFTYMTGMKEMVQEDAEVGLLVFRLQHPYLVSVQFVSLWLSL